MASRREWMFDPVTGSILDIKPEEGVLSSPTSTHVKRLSGVCDSPWRQHLKASNFTYSETLYAELSHLQDTVHCDTEVGFRLSEKGFSSIDEALTLYVHQSQSPAIYCRPIAANLRSSHWYVRKPPRRKRCFKAHAPVLRSAHTHAAQACQKHCCMAHCTTHAELPFLPGHWPHRH